MDDNLQELIAFLNAVPESYFDFVSRIANYVKKKESRMEIILQYLREH